MIKTVLGMGLSALLMTSASAGLADDLTVERLHRDPALAGPRVNRAAVAPDGSLVTLLRGRKDDQRQQDLWAFDMKDLKPRLLVSSTDLLPEPETLSAEEKNRRERQRIRANGITAYGWDEQGEALLFPLGGDVFLHKLKTRETRRITETEARETDAKISPKGTYVSFVRGDELFVTDAASGAERQVTSGAGGTIRNAVAEFVAQEEMKRNTGYWWSPDEALIAFTQIDEAPVPIAERLEFSKSGSRTERQRYPFAGTQNVRIKLAVTTPEGAEPVWVDLGAEEDIYLHTVYWAADGKTLYVERQSRDQKRLDFLAADPATGESRVLFSETADTWVNLHTMFHALDDGGFVRASERSGFMHLYHHDANGKVLQVLTKGDWPVTELNCVNEATGEVFFTGWQDSVIDRQIYKASLAGGDTQALTKGPGWRSAKFAKNCTTFIMTYSGPAQPPRTSIHGADGTFKAWINRNALDKDHPYRRYLDSHEPWEFGTIDAADGTKLNYQLLKPGNIAPSEKRPAVVLIYGGPHAQTVRRSWHGLFAQYLADQGYVVFRLDNRGSANRGTAFENHLHRKMGTPETQDQVLGAKFLGSLPYVDANRIGVMGWSYGGYMTLHLLAKASDVFAAGVAGAPVTDWALYDTHYTERYMGLPQDGGAYEESSVFPYLEGLTSKLLLIHGMSDDNVLFQNSITLMDALQTQGTHFDLMTYPAEKHGFRSIANSIHRDQLILDFFNRHLKGE